MEGRPLGAIADTFDLVDAVFKGTNTMILLVEKITTSDKIQQRALDALLYELHEIIRGTKSLQAALCATLADVNEEAAKKSNEEYASSKYLHLFTLADTLSNQLGRSRSNQPTVAESVLEKYSGPPCSMGRWGRSN